MQETKETKPVPELSSPVKEAESENQVDQAQKEKESEEPIQESADKAQLLSLIHIFRMYVLRSKVTIELADNREVAGFVGSAPTNLGNDTRVFELDVYKRQRQH